MKIFIDIKQNLFKEKEKITKIKHKSYNLKVEKVRKMKISFLLLSLIKLRIHCISCW